MTNQESLIEVRGLKVDFNLFEGTVHALDGVDFDIKTGKNSGSHIGCGGDTAGQPSHDGCYKEGDGYVPGHAHFRVSSNAIICSG